MEIYLRLSIWKYLRLFILVKYFCLFTEKYIRLFITVKYLRLFTEKYLCLFTERYLRLFTFSKTDPEIILFVMYRLSGSPLTAIEMSTLPMSTYC